MMVGDLLQIKEDKLEKKITNQFINLHFISFFPNLFCEFVKTETSDTNWFKSKKDWACKFIKAVLSYSIFDSKVFNVSLSLLNAALSDAEFGSKFYNASLSLLKVSHSLLNAAFL